MIVVIMMLIIMICVLCLLSKDLHSLTTVYYLNYHHQLTLHLPNREGPSVSSLFFSSTCYFRHKHFPLKTFNNQDSDAVST